MENPELAMDGSQTTPDQESEILKTQDEQKVTSEVDDDPGAIYLSLKNRAQGYYLASELPKAYSVYFEALPYCQFKDQKVTLEANLALTALKMGRIELCFTHCDGALGVKGVDLDENKLLMVKVGYRMALAMIKGLRDYQGAGRVLKGLKKQCNVLEEVDMAGLVARMIEKASELENQRDRGKYRGVTFAYSSGLSQAGMGVEDKVADYVSSKLEIGEVEGKGRCVTAAEKINRGETLMVCQAVACHVREPGVKYDRSTIEAQLVDQLSQLQERNPLTTSLALNYLKGGPLEERVMGNFDIFTKSLSDFLAAATKKGPQSFRLLDRSQLANIVRQNTFTSMGPLLRQRTGKDKKTNEQAEASAADCLFTAPSFLNHSCQPNAHRSFFREDSSVIFIKAVRDIQEFEEVTISYTDLQMSVEERSKETQAGWAFQCSCDRCVEERKIEELGHFAKYKRFLELSSVDELLKLADGEATPADLSPILLENYQALEAKLEQMMRDCPLEAKGDLFNPYIAQTLTQLLCLFLPENFNKLFPPALDSKDRHRNLMDCFGGLQKLAWGYFKRFESTFPQLLARTFDHLYAFKAQYKSEHSEARSVYQLMDPVDEERMFSRWEILYQWVYPVDWYEQSFVFNTMVKQMYEEPSHGHLAQEPSRREVESVQNDHSATIQGLEVQADIEMEDFDEELTFK